MVLLISSSSLPFVLGKKIKACFYRIAQLTFLIIAYLVIVIFLEMFEYYSNYVPESKPKYVPFKFHLGKFLKHYGRFVYSFSCLGIDLTSVGVFAIKNQLKKKKHGKNLKSTFNISVVLLAIFFFAVALIGYASFGNDSEFFDLVILRPSLPNSKDIAMRVAYALFSFQGIC